MFALGRRVHAGTQFVKYDAWTVHSSRLYVGRAGSMLTSITLFTGPKSGAMSEVTSFGKIYPSYLTQTMAFRSDMTANIVPKL